MNKRLLLASITACSDVFYDVPVDDKGTVVSLKGNKKDLAPKIKELPEGSYKAFIDDEGNLHINQQAA